jgi:deaminated glutathione amidase
MKIKIATCQFPTSSDITKNLQYVLKQMKSAVNLGAHLAHFPEACLSGYARNDYKSFKGFDWDLINTSTHKVLNLARKLGLWVILGSAHPLSGKNKPHNSLYIINNLGELVDRYDKMFCVGGKSGRDGDLAHYSPGDHFCIFEIKGVRCGVLICHEYRYPELFRVYKQQGVELMFHSYHTANIDKKNYQEKRSYVNSKLHKLNRGSSLPEILIPASMQAAAASNHMSISCSNSSARESCWASFFVRPDGIITGRLRKNVTGILISTLNTNARFFDSTSAWRDRAMSGIYHSGTMVQDCRSKERNRL